MKGRKEGENIKSYKDKMFINHINIIIIYKIIYIYKYHFDTALSHQILYARITESACVASMFYYFKVIQ